MFKTIKIGLDNIEFGEAQHFEQFSRNPTIL